MTREGRDAKRRQNKEFLAVRVTGGVGSWFGKRSRNFWINLSRPVSRDRVIERLEETFGGQIEKISRPLTPMSLSYAFRLKRSRPVGDVWALCVKALAEDCLNGS